MHTTIAHRKNPSTLLLLVVVLVFALSNSGLAQASTVISTTTTSMDMFAYPKATTPEGDYSSPLSAWEDRFVYTVEDLASAYDRALIIAEVPTADIAALDALNADFEALSVTLKQTIDELEAQYQADGYWDANTMLEFNRAFYTWNYEKYELVRVFFNTHGLMGDETGIIEQYYLNVLNVVLSYGMGPYMQIPSYDPNFVLTVGDSVIEPLYDAVYTQLAPFYANQDALEVAIAQVMEQSLRVWIHTMDIDFFTAYQAQVLLYLQNAKDFGMVYDLDSDEIVFDYNVANSRPIQLSDLLNSGDLHLGLFEDFFNANIDAAGTGFLTPEEVFAGPYIQQIIAEQIMYPFEQYDGSVGYFTKANTLQYCYTVISAQYSALSIPGSTNPPIPNQFPQTLGTAMNYYGYFETLPFLTSWIPQGAHTTVYDEYRHRNYLVVPFVDLYEESVVQVTRTITYRFEDGTIAAPSVTQTVTFTVSRDLLSDQVASSPVSAVLPAVSHPSVTYPAGNVTVLPPTQTVGALTVYWDTPNSTVDVVFPLEYPNGQTPGGGLPPTGDVLGVFQLALLGGALVSGVTVVRGALHRRRDKR